MKVKTRAIEDILEERLKQRKNFATFDKTNSKNDWIAYINAYTGRAADKVLRNEREGQDFRDLMVKAAALAVAAVEAFDSGYLKNKKLKKVA